MSRPSKMPEGGKQRINASATLDGTTATFGDTTTPDLLTVSIDASGELVVGTAAAVDGVIYVPEGRKNPDVANFNDVIGGKAYTVLVFAEIQEFEGSGFSAGDKLWADAAGAVSAASTAGDIFIGTVVPDPTVPGGTGLKLWLNVNGRPPA